MPDRCDPSVVYGYAVPAPAVPRGESSSHVHASHICLFMADVAQAIKIFSKSALKKKRDFVTVSGRRTVVTALDKAHKELAIMKKVRHFNVISCYEIIDDVDGDGLYLGACSHANELCQAVLAWCSSFMLLMQHMLLLRSARVCFRRTSNGLAA